jgi:hypothetical protein
MREQACREKIHKTAELCNLSPETVTEIDRIAGFVKEHPHISRLTTDAVKPLMAISDPEKQQEAISHVEKTLTRKTPTGGTYTKRLTKPEVEKIIEKVLPSETPKTETCVIFPAPTLPAPDIEYEPHVVAPVTSPIPLKQKVSAQEFYAAELFKTWGRSLDTFLITIRSDQPGLSEGRILYDGVLALAEAKKKR